MEGSPGQYHYPGGRNRFRTVKQLAQGHSGHNRKMVRKSMPSSSRMNLEIKKKSKSEEGAGCPCWGVPLSSAAASGLAPHPGYGHHRHHDTLGMVTVPMRVTLLDFLKLERKYGSPRGQRRVWCTVIALSACFGIISREGSAGAPPTANCLSCGSLLMAQ